MSLLRRSISEAGSLFCIQLSDISLHPTIQRLLFAGCIHLHPGAPRCTHFSTHPTSFADILSFCAFYSPSSANPTNLVNSFWKNSRTVPTGPPVLGYDDLGNVLVRSVFFISLLCEFEPQKKIDLATSALIIPQLEVVSFMMVPLRRVVYCLSWGEHIKSQRVLR